MSPSRPSACPATFELATALIQPGGHVANIGVHGTPATLHLEDLWIRNVTITTGLVDAYSTQTLLRLVGSGQLDAGRLVTHHFQLDEMEQAYDVFGDAAEHGCAEGGAHEDSELIGQSSSSCSRPSRPVVEAV